MLARALRIDLIVELLVYALAVWWLCPRGDCPPVLPVVAAIGIYLLLRLLFMLVGFSTARRYWEPTPKPLGLVGGLRLVLGEWLTSLAVYTVLHPLEPWLNRERTGQGTRDAVVPVVLVHGFMCNGAVWWSVRRRLRKAGYPAHHALTLEPLFNDIDTYATQLAAYVERVRNQHGVDRVLLVAHSMGGLVARTYVERLGGAARVSGVLTLGSPHHGTALAAMMTGRNVQQMRLDNDWLQQLNQESEARPAVALTSIRTWHDNIVVPQSTSLLSGARNRSITGVGHLSMLFSRHSQDVLIAELDRLCAAAIPTGDHAPR